MENAEQPLLSNRAEGENPLTDSGEIVSSFTDDDDMGPINGLRDFMGEFFVESKKLWNLAGPSIFTSICQYTIGAATQVFAGQLGTIQLAAFSVENSVIAAFSYGILAGMVSALETLCGQAFGAGQVEMLGVFMQRSWVILHTAVLGTTFLFVFAKQILKLLGQTSQISSAAGNLAAWMIPQQFAYAIMFPTTKFLQAQSKVLAMALIAAAALVLHVFLCWLLMVRLGWDLAGAAVALNFSWWFMAVAQVLYIFVGTCGRAWSGFSMKALHDLCGFVSLSLASALMFCLELWYTMALVLFAGYLKNAEISVDGLSVCMNIQGWASMAAIGFNAAISVRVSNELGSGRPRTAKFSAVVVGISSFLLGLFIAFVLIVTRKQYPSFFTNSAEVEVLVNELTPLLGLSIVVSNVQYTLQGVAIGAGWQSLVAYMNMGSYFLFGIPLSVLMGYIFNMGVKGIWYGMVSGITLQTCLLFWMICRKNWSKEACIAGERTKHWEKEDKLRSNIRRHNNAINL